MALSSRRFAAGSCRAKLELREIAFYIFHSPCTSSGSAKKQDKGSVKLSEIALRVQVSGVHTIYSYVQSIMGTYNVFTDYCDTPTRTCPVQVDTRINNIFNSHMLQISRTILKSLTNFFLTYRLHFSHFVYFSHIYQGPEVCD